jgi:hypothetical protein
LIRAVIRLRVIALHHAIARQIVTLRSVPTGRLFVTLKALLDRKKSDESPTDVAGVYPLHTSIRDAVTGAEPRREIPSSAERRYGWCASLEVRFAATRTVNKWRQSVNAD